ncbi:MAG: hypothetical protein J1F65_05310 [Clostridiales bacterium]|nr:hypothetical protein [Clostridiales bacterium]
MTKTKKIVALLVVVAMLFTFVAAIAACAEPHECGHVCETCHKCTDATCEDKVCAEKCEGHGSETTHTCKHVCATCGKCTDTACQDTACAQKCPGHQQQGGSHECKHVCSVCNKCQDTCTDSACAQKCETTCPGNPDYDDGKGNPAHVKDKGIDDLVDNPPANLTAIYEVIGIWVPTGNDSDQYGNGKLIDKSSGKELVIYGMAPTEDAFSYNSDTGVYAFTNPKAFQSIKDQFAAGDEIKLGVAYSSQYKNYYSYFISREEVSANILYEATLTFDNEKGSASLSKTSGLVYGEEVTITATPAANFKIGTVKFNGVEINKTGEDYKFKTVVGKNEVEVNFAPENEKTLKTLVIDLTSTASGIVAKADVSTTEVKETVINGITLKYLNCHQNSGYAMFNTANSWLANDTPINGTIVKVEIAINTGSSGSAVYYITIGTEKILETKTTGATATQTGLGTTNSLVAEVSEQNGGSYFNVSQSSSKNGQIKTITVSYYEA